MKLTDENYVSEAERVMTELYSRRYKLSTSKIRNILSMIAEIYNDVRYEAGEHLSKEILSRIQYLKVHVVYEAGREPTVKEFIEEANLIEAIDAIGNDKNKFLTFCHYMEALVAYHRFKGGKD